MEAPSACAPGASWLCRSAAAVIAAAIVVAAAVVVAVAAAIVVAAAVIATAAVIAAAVAVPIAAAAAAEQDNDQNDDPAAARAIVIPHKYIPPVRCEAGSPQTHHMREVKRGVSSGAEFLPAPARIPAAPPSGALRPPYAGPASAGYR